MERTRIQRLARWSLAGVALLFLVVGVASPDDEASGVRQACFPDRRHAQTPHLSTTTSDYFADKQTTSRSALSFA